MGKTISIQGSNTKEERAKQLLLSLEQVKSELTQIIELYEEDDDDAAILDGLTDALDALEDASEMIEDVIG